jgi:hypothetical protein
MELLLSTIAAMDESQLITLSNATLTGRRDLLRKVLDLMKPKMTLAWIQRKVNYMSGIMDDPKIIEKIKDSLLEKYSFDIVRGIIDDLRYKSISRRRYEKFTLV